MHSISTRDHLIILIFALSFNLMNGILSLANLDQALKARQKRLGWFLGSKCILGIVLNFFLESMLITLYILDLSSSSSVLLHFMRYA